jgi:hypothetical protein
MSTPKAAPGPERVLNKPTFTVSAARAWPENKTAAAKATEPKERKRTVMVCPVKKERAQTKTKPHEHKRFEDGSR